jgi:hypothetical protein
MILLTRVAAASTPIAPTGVTVITASVAKTSVQVKIRTHEVQIGRQGDERPKVIDSNCTYSRYPCSNVDEVDIVVNGNELFVPRSVFCDLADLASADLVVGRRTSVLTLHGGGASEAYFVKVEFDETQVKKRVLTGAMSPKEPLQETVYHSVTLGE